MVDFRRSSRHWSLTFWSSHMEISTVSRSSHAVTSTLRSSSLSELCSRCRPACLGWTMHAMSQILCSNALLDSVVMNADSMAVNMCRSKVAMSSFTSISSPRLSALCSPDNFHITPQKAAFATWDRTSGVPLCPTNAVKMASQNFGFKSRNGYTAAIRCQRTFKVCVSCEPLRALAPRPLSNWPKILRNFFSALDCIGDSVLVKANHVLAKASRTDALS
mmetsp:Transcript_26915/g.48416  ORF Transcript_26915/g.48416 Transcript_26915/m.48416 type:complete len:219 (-) Transcript_26915:1910-2566(-)